MKKSIVLASTLFGFLSLALSPAVKAEVTITPRNNGDVVVSPGNGGCTVLFNSRGEIITNGSSCSDRDINKARKAMDSYLREQNASDSDEHPRRGGGYADSDAGGPDFWEITGVQNNDLGLKAEPSLNSQFRVKGLHNGTILRNLGCENHGGDRWCRVEVQDNPSQNGWARMQYLRESGGSSRSSSHGNSGALRSGEAEVVNAGRNGIDLASSPYTPESPPIQGGFVTERRCELKGVPVKIGVELNCKMVPK